MCWPGELIRRIDYALVLATALPHDPNRVLPKLPIEISPHYRQRGQAALSGLWGDPTDTGACLAAAFAAGRSL